MSVRPVQAAQWLYEITTPAADREEVGRRERAQQATKMTWPQGPIPVGEARAALRPVIVG